ncbi:MAG: Mn-dependent transcriptional regulator MntR [Anaerolineae bacterium]|jgi:DtxR family Mn-dependent transcriptional regulator|nr:MAG: Mn-dependent transcriptional regulator MntR [Anaerolineae bacterium]
MNIVIIILVCLTLIYLFFPTYGGLARYKKWQEKRQRELVEDALKYLLDQEQQGHHSTVQSLGTALRINPRKAIALVDNMLRQQLIERLADGLHLTAEGERWALHVLRAHRLWERYLADEAQMRLTKIHREAHRREHTLTTAELDSLEAALGHPTIDPHGDPIPGRDGHIRALEAIPLTSLEADRLARIVHLEDEPTVAYEQVLAAGLALGQIVRIIEKTPVRFVLSDGEHEYRLAPSVAANVQVAPLKDPPLPRQETMALSELPLRQEAEIVYLDESVQGLTRRRFLDLGLTPGAVISPELDNFFGDPRGYRVRGTLIALRKEQAQKIKVKRLDPAPQSQ